MTYQSRDKSGDLFHKQRHVLLSKSKSGLSRIDPKICEYFPHLVHKFGTILNFNSGFSSERTNLSPFTKDFRGEEHSMSVSLFISAWAWLGWQTLDACLDSTTNNTKLAAGASRKRRKINRKKKNHYEDALFLLASTGFYLYWMLYTVHALPNMSGFFAVLRYFWAMNEQHAFKNKFQ